MLRIGLTLGWQTPIFPDWNDHTDGGEFARRKFYHWLFSVGVDRSGGSSSLWSFGLLGFYVTLFVSHFWQSPGK